MEEERDWKDEGTVTVKGKTMTYREFLERQIDRTGEIEYRQEAGKFVSSIQRPVGKAIRQKNPTNVVYTKYYSREEIEEMAEMKNSEAVMKAFHDHVGETMKFEDLMKATLKHKEMAKNTFSAMLSTISKALRDAGYMKVVKTGEGPGNPQLYTYTRQVEPGYRDIAFDEEMEIIRKHHRKIQAEAAERRKQGIYHRAPRKKRVETPSQSIGSEPERIEVPPIPGVPDSEALLEDFKKEAETNKGNGTGKELQAQVDMLGDMLARLHEAMTQGKPIDVNINVRFGWLRE